MISLSDSDPLPGRERQLSLHWQRKGNLNTVTYFSVLIVIRIQVDAMESSGRVPITGAYTDFRPHWHSSF